MITGFIIYSIIRLIGRSSGNHPSGDTTLKFQDDYRPSDPGPTDVSGGIF